MFLYIYNAYSDAWSLGIDILEDHSANLGEVSFLLPDNPFWRPLPTNIFLEIEKKNKVKNISLP